MKMDGNMPDKTFLFGSVLIVANRMDTLLDRALKAFDMTSKQWFLSVVLQAAFEAPPTMKALAKEMGSSHQNVKQVALKLEKKGMLLLEKDPTDARATRLKLTEESFTFWKKTQTCGEVFTNALFEDITPEELRVSRNVLQKMMNNLELMENRRWDNG